VKKRSVTLKGHATSITLEDAFWDALKMIADQSGKSVASLINEIDEHRLDSQSGGLSSAIRVYVLKHVIEHYKA